MIQVIDSHLHCPRCHKRMHQQVGQHESTGEMRAQHECWSCGYTEADKAWSGPLRTAGNLRRDWLASKRLEGWTHEIYIDPSPFPEEVWDA